jgi:hypothetical protein
LLNSKQQKAKAIEKQNELPFFVELKLNDKRVFCDILLEAIDKSFLSLGEPVKTSIYHYLEKCEIKKHEIPFRICDFQNALERLFGIGSRSLEILFIKNLSEKIKVKFKNDLSHRIVPELTFQEYIRLTALYSDLTSCSQAD